MRIVIAAMFALTALSGCLSGLDSKDGASPEDDVWDREMGEMVVPDEVNGFGNRTVFETPGGGQGIWVHKDILFHTNGGDLWLFDVSNRTAPVMMGNITGIGARDVDVLEWQNNTFALLAGSGNGMHVINVTNPWNITMAASLTLPSAGVHNLAAVPGTPYIYSSGASGQRKIDVVDITDPYNPVVTNFVIPATFNNIPVNSNGCHDITVRVDLGRAYCAGGGSQYMSGGGESFIWDISEDPRNPVWLTMIDDPRLIYHHQAFVNGDGTILIINDEYIAQNCYHVDGDPLPGSLDPQVPFAAAWIYDVSDETNPVQMSHVQNPSGWNGEGLPPTGGNCGSHFGDLVTGHDVFVMGWYQGGTMMVDFSTPDDPEILDISPAEGSTWDSMYYDNYVFHSSTQLVIEAIV